MFKRIMLLLGSALVLTVVVSSVAFAATPQDIYNDFVDNGKLDNTYSDADLRAYLNDATISQYADRATKDRLDTLVRQLVTRDTFPFTGFQLALAVLVAVALVGGGFVLRRTSRKRS